MDKSMHNVCFILKLLFPGTTQLAFVLFCLYMISFWSWIKEQATIILERNPGAARLESFWRGIQEQATIILERNPGAGYNHSGEESRSVLQYFWRNPGAGYNHSGEESRSRLQSFWRGIQERATIILEESRSGLQSRLQSCQWLATYPVTQHTMILSEERSACIG